MTDKKLEFKFAHITGQAMRDHWGPIVERIAEETADWRDEWIYDLITENERLREANRIARMGLIGDIDSEDAWEIALTIIDGGDVDWGRYPEARAALGEQQ